MAFFDLFSRKKERPRPENTLNYDYEIDETSEIAAYNEEIADEAFDFDNLQAAGVTQPYNSYRENGVEMQGEQKTVRIMYNGILAKNGADSIYAVVGYGNNLKWEHVDYYPLHRVNADSFELLLPVTRGENINIAFKDSANNWDNNSGMNYTFSNNYNEGSS